MQRCDATPPAAGLWPCSASGCPRPRRLRRVAGRRPSGQPDGGGATGTTNGAAKTADKDPQQAALDFAKRMREHGIDMPDPQVDDQGRVRVRVGGLDGGRPDPKKLDEPRSACGHLMGGGDGAGQIDPEERDAMVAFARCMREHGIDMPDPTGDGLVMRKDDDRGPDPSSEQFQAAEKACDHHLATLGRGKAGSEERS